jgi:hypothetical protein
MANTKVQPELLAAAAILRGYIDGLTMSTAGSSTTMSIAAGMAADSTGSAYMSLAASISKTTSAWAVGAGNGGLDTGAIANNTWYHFFEIKRPDTGVVDVLFSLSASAPTMPANYTLKRRIGSGLTNGSGQWVKFVQNGDEFLWDTTVIPTSLADGTNTYTTTATLATLTVPTGVQVNALFVINPYHGTLSVGVRVTSPDESDQAAGTNSDTWWPPVVNSSLGGANLNVRTNTSAQVRIRCSQTNTFVRGGVRGWIDQRGKNA